MLFLVYRVYNNSERKPPGEKHEVERDLFGRNRFFRVLVLGFWGLGFRGSGVRGFRGLGIPGLGSLIGAEEVSHSASHSWHGFMCLVASIP